MLRILPASLLAFGLFAGPGAAQDGDCNAAGIITAQLQCFVDQAKLAEDVSRCDAAEEPSVHFNCIALYAEHTEDPVVCKRITASEDQQQALRDACVAGVAISARDPEQCAGAEGTELRNACYMMLVVQYGADESWCAEIIGESLRLACAEGTGDQ